MKSLKLTTDQWLVIKKEIDRTHPTSVTMVRWKMKQVLGFTVRKHTQWITKVNKFGGMGYQEELIYLDFFDESKRTFFLLKYGDWIR